MNDDNMQDLLKDMRNRNDELEAENKRLREALEFYARHPMKDMHIEAEINGGEWVPFGTMAREALKANDGGSK